MKDTVTPVFSWDVVEILLRVVPGDTSPDIQMARSRQLPCVCCCAGLGDNYHREGEPERKPKSALLASTF